MKLKSTKTLAKELNKSCRGFNVSCVKMPSNRYIAYVNSWDYFNDECYDYDLETDTFNVLVISYPDDFYATNNFCSTRKLMEIFKRNNCRDFEDFANAFQEEFSI